MSEEKEEEEIEFEFEPFNFTEYIQAAYFALSSIEDIDEEILPSQAYRNRIKRIRFRSVKMIDYCLNEMYADLFGEEDEKLSN